MRKSDLWLKSSLFTGRLKFHFADNGTETPNSFLVSMSLSFGQIPPPKQSRRNKAATYLRYERRRDFVLGMLGKLPGHSGQEALGPYQLNH